MKATGTARYGCFTPTTPVLMADGTTRPIKDVRPGDRVASRDPATGRLVAATVDRTHTHARVPTIRLTTTSGTVTTTATHPVHVAGRGYVPAGHLRAGDTLTTPDHAPVHVVSVQATGHTTTVHNLTIRHTHNYHVHTTTKQAILVHNNGTNKTPGACDPPEEPVPGSGKKGKGKKPDPPTIFDSRNAALRAAKRDAGVPMNEHPSNVTNDVTLRGKPRAKAYEDHVGDIRTREYYYTGPGHDPVVIQDHAAGHAFGAPGGQGDQGPHFNVRPPGHTDNGKVPGTLSHYGFGDWSNVTWNRPDGVG